MATFIQLVNALERESGTIQKGSRLASVANAPNRQEKMVEWIVEAWRMIQTSRSDWPWMRREFEAPLIIGQARYTGTAMGLGDFARWARTADGYTPFTIYDPAIGRADETELRQTGWQHWKVTWDRGVHDGNRPIDVSVDMDSRLAFGPTPDKAYMVRGGYHRSAQILASDGDVPICPADFHDIIVWRAMMLLGEHDEAPVVISTATAKFQRLYRDLIDASIESVTL